MQFLQGVAITLLFESVALIFAIEWLQKKIFDDIQNNYENEERR